MLKPKRRLKDLIIDLIALVKSPATGIRFAIIKDMEGGDEPVDKIFQLIQEICAGETFPDDLRKSEIPEAFLEKVQKALSTLSNVIKDLPEEAQDAIKLVVKIAGYGYPAVEEQKESDKAPSEFVKMLQEIQAQVVNADKKFDATVQEVATSKGTMDEIKKSLSALVERLTALEKATGEEKSKGADEVKDEKKVEKAEEDMFESVIPPEVML